MAVNVIQSVLSPFCQRFVGTMLLLCAIAGCSSGETIPDGTAKVHKYSSVVAPIRKSKSKKARIALVMKSLADEFFSTMTDGASAHAYENPDQYELIVNGIADETDFGGQVALIEEMIAQSVDAIVIAPTDSQALISVLKRAHDAGIVLVCIDNKLEDAAMKAAMISVPFVGPDNRAGAKKVGEFLATKLAAGGAVAILEGEQTSLSGQQRKLGFDDAMSGAGVKVVASQSAQWETSIASQTTAEILTSHPEIKAILACNDNMALGAILAINAADRKDVLVVGFDNISAVQQAIRDGQILATADQHGGELAVFGIEFALKLLQDANFEIKDKETPVDLVTAEIL